MLGIYLLSCLQHIWTEIGESDEDKDRMVYELEKECVAVYRRKVEAANHAKVCLHQSVAAKEAELAALMSSLGEPLLDSKVSLFYQFVQEILLHVRIFGLTTFSNTSIYLSRQPIRDRKNIA